MAVFQKIKDFLYNSRIVLNVTTKPTKEEFKKIAIISGAGLLIIGAVGYLLSLILSLII
ncbi:MAG: protein translocase SEC61 complex subunit gamma [Candidatus Woesearchaeota archaeon]